MLNVPELSALMSGVSLPSGWISYNLFCFSLYPCPFVAVSMSMCVVHMFTVSNSDALKSQED